MKGEIVNRAKSVIITPNHVMDVLNSLNSTYQLHVFLLLIEKLKGYGQKEYDKYQSGQRALFELDTLTLKIPLSNISKASEYRDVKNALLEMSRIHCEIRYKEDSVDKIWSGSLFNTTIPVKANYSSIIKINMDIVVARLFINFNRNKDSRPIFYTTVDTNIRRYTKSKNALKLYLYLCLWRNKSFIKIKLSDLCNYLGLPKSYSSSFNFKKHILEGSYTILKSFKDVWYELEDIKFKSNEFNETILQLKLMTFDRLKIEDERKNSLNNVLINHFNFKEKDIEDISPIINSTKPELIIDKLSTLLNKIDGIKNTTNYVKQSLINEFKC